MIKKMILLAMELATKDLSKKRIDVETKQLRVLSCFGHENIGPCPKLQKSKNSEYYICGGCGCGDNKETWLTKKDGDYAKLDHLFVNCPLKMPGFTNYDPNFPKELERRKQIEDFDPENLKLIQVTVGRSEEKEKLAEELHKMLKNS